MRWHQTLHWIGQVAPPFLLLTVFSRHGPGFWFLLGVASLCFLVSLVTLAVKLVRFRKNKLRLVRPVLTLLIAGGLIAVAEHSYDVARAEVGVLFNGIEAQCRSDAVCPKHMAGWEEIKAGEVYRKKVGDSITYPVTYFFSGTKFSLHLTRSLDWGDTREGGVD